MPNRQFALSNTRFNAKGQEHPTGKEKADGWKNEVPGAGGGPGMNDALLLAYGLSALFALSLLAATVLPLGSEAGVVLLCVNGFDPLGVLLTASAGNILGAVVNYLLGRWGARLWRRRHAAGTSAAWRRARGHIRRWGAPVLFFAWAPIVGDPLTVAAGGLEIHPARFVFWVALGKVLRYAMLIQGTLMVAGH